MGGTRFINGIMELHSYNPTGKVKVVCDGYILTDDEYPVKFLSFTGTNMAVKAMRSQIVVSNWDLIYLMTVVGDQKKFLCKSYGGRLGTLNDDPFKITRGNNSPFPLLSCTSQVTVKNKDGNTFNGSHCIMYSEPFFQTQHRRDDHPLFLAYGATRLEMEEMAFYVVNNASAVPMSRSWKGWLWRKLVNYTEDNDVVQPVLGGNADVMTPFQYIRMICIPDDDTIHQWIVDEIQSQSGRLDLDRKEKAA